MKKAIIRIKELVSSLPRRDINLGYKFLEARDFISLQELIDSAIVRTNKNIHSNNPKKEYMEVNLDNLNSLKAEVDTYSAQINGFYEDINDEENYNDGEEFY